MAPTFSLEWITELFDLTQHPPSKTPVGVVPDSGEMIEQIDWRAKQPYQVAWFSEDLKC